MQEQLHINIRFSCWGNTVPGACGLKSKDPYTWLTTLRHKRRVLV